MTLRRAIGIDIGGTRLRAALVAEDGAILSRAETPTAAQAGPEAVVAQIAALAAEVAPVAERDGLLGAGISSPGPIDTVTGTALGVPTLAGWVNLPIAEMIGEALQLAVRLENDGIAAAHGEWRYGAGHGARNLVYVTVSTGIGGGVVADGRLLHGRRGMAGHIGHMSIVRDGTLCSCGNRGCWEAYASGTGFARRIAERLPGTDPRAVFSAARAGDGAALALVNDQAQWLGIGITNLLHLYSPDLVILGGGVSNGFAQMRAAILAEVQARAMPAFRDVPVVAAGLGENSGLIGAAALLF